MRYFRNGLLFLLGFSSLGSAFSQTPPPSPEQFLGYVPGAFYTPHWKIVAYFQAVAAAVPDKVQLQQYGTTYEGRPLILATVSDPENMRRLDAIRQNNRRLAGLSLDKMAPQENNAPALVWLSYNVHGNETSSSEAAMATLYELVNPDNTRTKAWLKNTVVLMDPCLNPDGRDRYVNWYKSVVGKYYNPLRQAREHREPWPGGRTNHYNFDLNRDWAWQTQTESRQRQALYQQWMPQVHVDFHEQGINEPYYFAPAAEPFHEVITPFQREFQTTIGRNHARYFDANGWLYFTKIRFDLFYPSYGDTWPTYNGAIGMTYEQGGIGAGLGIINEDGDTLTLRDRVVHHLTTSLSTIEVASVNAARLIREFRNYFSTAVQTGVGEYKTYLVKADDRNAERLEKLVRLLDQNEIRYAAGNGATLRGYNYATGKEEAMMATSADLVIPATQPKSALVKVLFEPQARLTDSLTYDITAWALPYAYGLTALASREKPALGGPWRPSAFTPNPETQYGYVLPWTGLKSARLAGRLLKQGVLLRFAEQAFETAGRRFEAGSILILRTANQRFGDQLWSRVRREADAENLQLIPVSSGWVDKGSDFGSDLVRTMRAPRVALLTGEGVNSNAAGECWHFLEQELDYPVTLVNAADAGRMTWADWDVVIFPDGNYRFLNNKDELENFKNWIQKGGRVLALEGAVAQLARAEIGLKVRKGEEGKDDEGDAYDDLHRYENRERDAVSGQTPGSVWRVTMDNTHPLAFGYPDFYYTLKQDGQLYEFLKDGGWNVGVLKKEKQVAGFVGAGLQSKLKDGLLFGVQPVGNGQVIALTDNPLFRLFWENGKLMICNALFFVGQ